MSIRVSMKMREGTHMGGRGRKVHLGEEKEGKGCKRGKENAEG